MQNLLDRSRRLVEGVLRSLGCVVGVVVGVYYLALPIAMVTYYREGTHEEDFPDPALPLSVLAWLFFWLLPLLAVLFLWLAVALVLAAVSSPRLWWENTWDNYEHTAGSLAVLALLFLFLAVAMALSTRILLSSVVAIPLWLLLSVAVVKFIARGQQRQRELRRLQQEHQRAATRLSRVETDIARLQREKEKLAKKHETPLGRRAELEKEIRRLIAVDSANLGVRTNQLRSQARNLSEAQLREQMRNIDEGLKGIRRSTHEAKDRLSALEKEEEVLSSERRAIEQQLREFEMMDPRNVGVRVSALRSKWQQLSLAELETAPATGEIARLLRQQLLLDHRIADKTEEVGVLCHQIEDSIAEDVLLLERRVLEEEEIARTLGLHEPRLLEIDDQLRQLEADRHGLEAENSKSGADMERLSEARTRLEVGKNPLLLMTACTALAVAGLGGVVSSGEFTVAPYLEEGDRVGSTGSPSDATADPVTEAQVIRGVERWIDKHLSTQFPYATLLHLEFDAIDDHVWAVAFVGDAYAAQCREYEELKQRVPTVDEGGILFPGICEEIWPYNVFSPSYAIFGSADRGETWDLRDYWIPEGGVPQLYWNVAIDFMDEQNGAITLFDEEVLRTADGGQSWRSPE